MTMTAVKEDRLDIEQIHPVLSSTYQIQIAEKELATLGQKEEEIARERLSLLSGGNTEAPQIREKLEGIEAEILRLQTRQRREQDKISALTGELPELRKEAEKQLDKLVELYGRLPKASLEIEGVNAELEALVNEALVEQLTGLIERRNTLVKEYQGIPWLIQNLKSYFHLQPGIQEVEVPKLPEHINDLVGALSK